MRTHGTLVRWNDERGFGFVAIAQGGEEVFVHVSAFPRDGVRPRVGEVISFDVNTGPDGRRRAIAVRRAAAANATRSSGASRRHARRPALGRWGAALPLLGLGIVGYVHYEAELARSARPAEVEAPTTTRAATPAPSAFRCDGRTHCAQMTSCAEAQYFLQHCPGVQMDGNGDGEPCEEQWCR